MTISRRPPAPLVAALLAAALFALACDGDSGSGPDPGTGSFFFSFESGLEGWRPDSADFCGGDSGPGGCDGSFAETEVTVVRVASDGERSVELVANNLTDAVKLWIERPFPVAPGERYRVSVMWDFGTADLEIGAWQLIATVTPFDPSAAFRDGTPEGQVGDFLRLGDTVSPNGALEFIPASLTREVEAGASGELWVGIGVWGTFEVERTYYLDRVTVRIDRIS